MKLNINKEDLLEPLQKVFGVIERRQTLPILSNVYLSINNGTIKFTGTDLEVQVSAKSILIGEDSFNITIPARKLLDICRSLPDHCELNLSFNDGVLIIKSGKSRFTLRTLPSDEYPLFDESSYLNQISINQEVLLKAFSKTIFCMAQQDVRYYLNGLMMEIVDGELQTVASDGHRLALSKNKIDNENQSINQVIIPRKAAQELLRLMDKFEGAVEIKIAKNSIKFSLGDVELNAKLIDGRFPDFNNVVPEQSKHSFNINKLSFKSALSRVSILSNEKYKGIRLDLSNQLMTINANNPEQDEAEEEVVVDYNGDEMSMGFNSSYLMDALNVIESDNVLVSFTDTNSSCLLENPEDKSSQFIIMPMRI
ncbi:MAG: DNA polymerase-3 subunit beta [Cycloclasticus pugetii]|jgi:DNA polymerase-3 subunit beta|uniref:Beta sliding clamp n=1 Tax=Cycloclasticus zancles 78-ME TaxID=1198232 RepID=S5T3L6_9GAMM|nr:DNA polymerase III subunit beta [Cycloclasticus zancles]AGS38346.1 DNA polymerase III subunit beta [Cycloclasticus zancles 78-ME]